MASVVTLSLTCEQAHIVAPPVRQAAKSRQNVVFVAAAAPNNGVWRIQITTISGATATKILRLLEAEDRQREAARTGC